MFIKYLFLVVIFCGLSVNTRAQQLSFKDTIASYNAQRINTNRKGVLALGTWGIANIAGSGIGYFTATKDEWKYFHEMNVLWGVVNTGIAAMGMAGVRKEMGAKLNYRQSYDRFLSNKKLYLINAGLDIAYIGAGIALTEYGSSTKSNAAIFKGFGRSFTIQGVFLLFFDNIMFASHLRYNSKWFTIMNEIRLTNTGIGFTHTF